MALHDIQDGSQFREMQPALVSPGTLCRPWCSRTVNRRVPQAMGNTITAGT
jgi:hypothetical protein